MCINFRHSSILLFWFCLLLPSLLPAQQLTQADLLFNEGKYGEAIQVYTDVARVFENNNQTDNYALAHLKIAKCHIRLGEVQDGLTLGLNTLEYLTDELKTDNKTLLAEAYDAIGEGYLHAGRNDQAEQYLLRSLDAYESAGEKESYALANCYNDLGIVYWNNGNNQLALQYHQNALKIREKRATAPTIAIADSYNNIGLIYSGYAYDNATLHFEKALGIYRNLLGENHPKVALCYNNLALVNDSQKQYNEALDYLYKVEQIWNATYEGEHPNKAFTLASMGNIHFHKKEYALALLRLEKALQSYHLLYGTHHPEIANVFNQLGEVHLSMGHFEEAIAYYQKGLYANLYDQEQADVYVNPELKNYYNADILLFSLQQKARAFETLHYNKTLKLKDLKAALSCLELADKLISRIRQIRLNEKDKLALSAKASEIYEAGVLLCYAISEVTFDKQYYLHKAFDFAEKSKSSTLLSAIQDTNAKQFSGIPGPLLEEETQLKNDIAYYERKLAQSADENEQKRLTEKLLILNTTYNSFIKKLEEEYPRYFNLKFNENYISLPVLQRTLNDRTAFVTHFITTDRIFAFYVTAERFDVYNRPKSDRFDNYVSGLRNAIKYDSRTHFVEAASMLYAQLFPMRMGRKITDLIIVPDGALATIPFEALVMPGKKVETLAYGELPYVVKKYNVSYDNSATLYAQRKQEIEQYQAETEDILLVAPVGFEQEYYADLSTSLNDLPGSKNEINEIKHLFRSKAHQTTVLADKQATEINLKEEPLHRYKYLHFATHGMVDESNPELSRIFLRPTYNDKEDGSLYSGEIYNISIHADLVCLSACQTGLGKLSKGEGIIGLSRALLYAGAENLIVSLWTVADESTSRLMIDFYQNHLYSHSYNTFSGALRKAKLKLLESDEFNRPYYWAPFILIGE